ncbi:MAG: hypothetical protein ACT4OJ_14180 [Bacteroidota bacterium]
MKNKLSDLNNHLFAMLERLGDQDLKGEELKQEIDRGKSMAHIATQIVQSAKITVDAMKLVGRGNVDKDDIKSLLIDKS